MQSVAGFLLIVGVAAVSNALKPHESSVRVECHGKLRHGIVAIGGETTGTTVTFNGMTWELQLPDEASRKFAQDNHKEAVTVVGTLRQVRGIAIPVRTIVDVERLTLRNAAGQKDGARIVAAGTLQHNNADGGWTIEAGGNSWPLDLSEGKDLETKASSLSGKPVTLCGRWQLANKSPPQPILQVEKLNVSSAKTALK